jgi:hypothetical protein
MTERPQKITFAETRDMGCARCRLCKYRIGDAWPDDLGLSDIEPRLPTAIAATMCGPTSIATQSRPRCDIGAHAALRRSFAPAPRNISPYTRFVSTEGIIGPQL